MKFVHDQLREGILRNLGVLPPMERTPKPSLAELKESEWNPEFEKLMRNRLIMGALRYETFAEKKVFDKYDTISTAISKLEKYRETGNDELLVDVANYMLLEFTFGNHPKKHFNATDDEDHCITKEAGNENS